MACWNDFLRVWEWREKQPKENSSSSINKTKSRSIIQRYLCDNQDEGKRELLRCAICLLEFGQRQKAVVTPCVHAFCVTCITRWMQIKQTCPLCKQNVLSVVHSIESDSKFVETQVRHFVTPRENLPSFRNISQSRRYQRRIDPYRLPIQRSFSNNQQSRVAWRKQVYEARAFAIPFSPHDHFPRLRVLLSSSSERDQEVVKIRAIPWIKRDLCVILMPFSTNPQDEDIEIFVQSILTCIFRDPSAFVNSDFQNNYIDQSFLDVMEPARTFLNEHTEHFFHELKCYLACTLAMKVYDTLIVYPTLRPSQYEGGRRNEHQPRDERNYTNTQYHRKRPNSRYN